MTETKPAKPKMRVVGVWLPETTYTWFRCQAIEEGMAVSTYVRRVLNVHRRKVETLGGKND